MTFLVLGTAGATVARLTPVSGYIRRLSVQIVRLGIVYASTRMLTAQGCGSVCRADFLVFQRPGSDTGWIWCRFRASPKSLAVLLHSLA